MPRPVETTTRHHRQVVSFTRRGGRLTDRQQHAWDAVADQWVIDVPRGHASTSVADGFELDPDAVFGRPGRLVVEIGSGRGESLVQAGKDEPGANLLGLEVYVPGVAQTLVSLRHRGVANVRLAIVDAAPALAAMLPAGSVDELRIWFPDPWHKKRHNKRRLISPAFMPLAARVLRQGGSLRLATDWQDYADQMRDVLAGAADFETGENADDGWAPRFTGRPITRFEAKGLAVGRTIRDLHAVRR